MIDSSNRGWPGCQNSEHKEGGMATSKELHAWVYALKGWARSVESTEVREHMLQVAEELERLAECKAAAERQLV
jgi:hypothetical protein